MQYYELGTWEQLQLQPSEIKLYWFRKAFT